MKITVTNATTHDINVLDTITGGSGPAAVLAVGGAKKYPLPYPFGHVGTLAASGSTSALPVHARDFRKGGPVPMAGTLEPGEEWNQLVQAGIVTLTIAADAQASDTEDLSIAVM